MEMERVLQTQQKEPYKKLIVALSIIIPLTVAILFGMPKVKGYDFTFLPPVYASINALTAVLLVTAVIAVRNNRRRLHEVIMKTCMGLSAAFLLMYIIYHMTTEATPFGGEGPIRYVYYFILITHVILSIVIVPLVLFSFGRALSGNFERHRAIAKFAFPLWVYVAVTGVLVYLLISPYYH